MKGLRFGRGPKTVDEYGFVVSAEASVPGGGWTSQHDRIKRAMAESAREMGQEVAMEVYGLFAAHIPQHGRAAMRELSSRTRHGLVPDFMMWIRLGRDPVKQYLLELKCAHLSPTWYAPKPWRLQEEAQGKSCLVVEKRVVPCGVEAPREGGRRVRRKAT